MKKIKTYKGWIIAQFQKENDLENFELNRFYIFTQDEWKHGKGLRSPEWDAGSLKEAEEFINSY